MRGAVVLLWGMERIVIEPTRIIGERGQQYRVLYRDKVLVERTWNPEYDAARALFALGRFGDVEGWRPGKAHADSIVHVLKAVALTMVEDDSGLRQRLWTEPPGRQLPPPAAG